MAGGIAEKPDALPRHSSPNDVRHSYATDATMVGRTNDAYGTQGYPHSPVSPVAAAHKPQVTGTTPVYAAPPAAEMPVDEYRRANHIRTGNNGTF